MDLGIIIAIVGSAIANIGVGLTLFLWIRGEANSDRKDIVNLIIAIKDESKEFHAKLCVLDERYLQIFQKMNGG